MFFVLFGSWGGGGGCISIHEKERGLRQHTINYIYREREGERESVVGVMVSVIVKRPVLPPSVVDGLSRNPLYYYYYYYYYYYVLLLVYYILFFHFLQLWLLSLNVMCCGLQLVLWFHLLALLNLGSRLQGFVWRSADKVPAWKSEQLLIPCNWWHPLGACWSACKTKPLQTGVKCSWVFYRIKVAWSCHCFAWEQMTD